jgi:hypothetical protein
MSISGSIRRCSGQRESMHSCLVIHTNVLEKISGANRGRWMSRRLQTCFRAPGPSRVDAPHSDACCIRPPERVPKMKKQIGGRRGQDAGVFRPEHLSVQSCFISMACLSRCNWSPSSRFMTYITIGSMSFAKKFVALTWAARSTRVRLGPSRVKVYRYRASMPIITLAPS